ncbi:MAG: YqcC family protein [Cyclobacteriaceae bacterium]
MEGQNTNELYALVSAKAKEIENELRRSNRWQAYPLPDEKFTDLGAFGTNTMSFEQWLQFVLIPRISEIIESKDAFPEESQLSTYAIRYFDGDDDSGSLQGILYDLDQLINKKTESPLIQAQQPNLNSAPPTVSVGDSTIPAVLFSISEVLPQFELKDLESQLQTFDTFLEILSPTVRPAISTMIKKAADKTVDQTCRQRLEQASRNVAVGKQAAAPYNHEEAMKKYQEEHRKNYPTQDS